MIATQDNSIWELIPLFGFAVGAAFSVGLVAPLYGVLLCVRGTSFQGIALPQTAACGVAFGFAVKPWFQSGTQAFAHQAEHSLTLQLLWALVFTFAGVALIGRRPKPGASANSRVAGLFAASSALTVLFAHASPEGEIFVHDLLHGEILALNRAQFFLVLIGFGALLALFLQRRRIFSLVSFDREAAIVMGLRVTAIEWTIAIATGVLIAVGTMTVGPMILFGLIVLPPLAARPFSRSMEHFFFLSALIGVTAALGGVMLSFQLDEPFGPSIVAVAVLLLGLSWIAEKLSGGQ